MFEVDPSPVQRGAILQDFAVTIKDGNIFGRSEPLSLCSIFQAPSVQYQLPRLVHVEPAKRGRGADYKYKVGWGGI